MENKPSGKTKSIVIATGIFPPSIGGPATYSKMLEEELPKRELTPIIVSFDSVRKWPKGIRHFIYFLKLWNAAAGAYLIYAQDPVSVGYPAMWVAKLRGKKFFLKVVGDYAWEQGCQRYGVTDLLDVFLENKKYPSGVKKLRKVEKKVAKRAERIIVPSEYLKGVVAKWGIDAKKIAVIPNALEGVLPPEEKDALRAELGMKKKTIFSAGRLVPWKGFAVLIEGWAEFLKEKDLSLLIAGSGPDKATLEALIKKNGLEDRVVLLGGLPRHDLLRYLKAADVFALNTAYEGFSHQILEAMAIGTPIVTTAVGGNPEMIEDGVHGFLVALNDTEAFKERVGRILSDPALASALASHARERASIFGRGRAVESLISLLP